MGTDEKKPTLYLLPGSEAMNAESLAKLYQRLTGKPTTPQEMEECRQRLLAGKVLPPVSPDKADTDCNCEGENYGM